MPADAREMELLSRQINQAHRTLIQAELAAAGLGEVGHPMLLSILQRTADDGPSRCPAQCDLATALHISPAAVANSLKSLEKGGYIRREPGAADARRNQVTLTEKGAQAVAACEAIFVRVSRRMLAGFSPEEREQLMAFRTRMLNNLRGEDPPKNHAKEEP